MKRISVFLILIVLCLPFTARADDATRRAKATEMISLLHMDRLMAQMMDGIMQQTQAMTRQMAGGKITAEDQAKVDAFQKKIFDLIDSQVGWKVMEPEYVTLYANSFTDEELDGILAFYRSPAGISMVAKLPALTTQAMQLSQARMVAVQPQIKQMVEDFAKQAQDSDQDQPATHPRK